MPPPATRQRSYASLGARQGIEHGRNNGSTRIGRAGEILLEMTNLRFALLYLAILVPLLAAVFAYDALLVTGVLNAPMARSVVLTRTLPAAVFLLPFLASAMLFFRVTQWGRSQGTSSWRGMFAHVGRCGVLYLALLTASMGLHLQTQTDVMWPWTGWLYLSVPALGGALCGIIWAERRAAAAASTV